MLITEPAGAIWRARPCRRTKRGRRDSQAPTDRIRLDGYSLRRKGPVAAITQRATNSGRVPGWRSAAARIALDASQLSAQINSQPGPLSFEVDMSMARIGTAFEPPVVPDAPITVCSPSSGRNSDFLNRLPTQTGPSVIKLRCYTLSELPIQLQLLRLPRAAAALLTALVDAFHRSA